jgi:hypothetical protein
MFDSSAPTPLDYQLPADAYYHLIRTLRLTLPPPPDDSPEALLRRDHAAIASIAGLAPGDAAEAKLAAQFVAASEHWMDCLRLAQAPDTTREWAAKYRAQAASMMRQANSALRLLQRTQATRRKLEADNAACDRLAWTEHGATRLMAEALEQPAASPAPAYAEVAATARAGPPPILSQGERACSGERRGQADAAETPPAPALAEEREPEPAAKPKPSPSGRGLGEGAGRAAPVEEPDPLAEAEHYAILYPERAALIRRMGRLPDDLSFGPPDDNVVQALIAGRSPALAALDRAFAEAHAA